MDWQDIQFFLHIARAGSARAVAQALSVSHTTVARRIDSLEASLGTRLFERKVAGFSLTASGAAMMEYALVAEDALETAERKLQGRDHELSGQVRLTAPDVIATELLLPNIRRFSDAYPNIDLELQISSQVLNVEKRESDVALRILGYGSQPPEPLIGRNLGEIAACYYASSDYLQEKDLGDPQCGAKWLGWVGQDPQPIWVRNSPYPEFPCQYQLNAAALQVQAAKAGLGMVMLPCFLADHVAELQRLPGAEPHLNHELWLLSHPDHREVARIKVVREFVVQLFGDLQNTLLGISGRP